MADQKLHSLCPEKNVFCRYCVTNQAGLSIATRHWVKFSRKPICIFLDSLKSMHSATECNSQRDLVCIGAIPLKNFRSRDYEIINEKVRPIAGVSQKWGPTKLEHSWCWQRTFLELFVKRATTQTQELSLKAVPLPEESKSAPKIEHGWRLFLKSYQSPIPHTPVLIIIWWNGKKPYIICPLINALV